MKKILLLLLVVSVPLSAQEKETIDIKWKVSDTLTFKTVMKESVLKKDGDSTANKPPLIFKDIQKQLEGLKYETKLFPDKKGNIDITMLMKMDKTDTTKTLFSQMAKMNGNVVLRGKVSPEGEFLSFYHPRPQNNLIAILFELPTKPVSVGDQWSIDVNVISMDQNFIANSYSKKNIVRLKDIQMKNGSKVAIIEYDIKQFASGTWENKMAAMFAKGMTDKEIFMKTSHKAIGEFDLDKGYWISYNGTLDIETNFSLMGMSGNKRTVFSLTPEEE